LQQYLEDRTSGLEKCKQRESSLEKQCSALEKDVSHWKNKYSNENIKNKEHLTVSKV